MLYGVEAQVTAGSGGATVPYSAHAVHFAGAIQSQGPTYLSRSSLSSPDDQAFSTSFWANGLDDSLNNNAVLWVVDPAGEYNTNYTLTTKLSVPCHHTIALADLSSVHEIFTRYPPITAGWHHILYSIDLSLGSGTKVEAFYLDDVLQTPVEFFDSDPAFTPLFNGLPFVFGDDTFASGPTCDFSDVWIAPGVLLIDETGGTISDATRRMFTDFTTASGCTPIDPTTFPSSAVLFTGGPSTFATNQGTGGAFTLTGSLTAAATNPP